MPPYVALPKMHNSGGAAYLGSKYAPFVVNSDPNAPDFKVPDLVPPLAIDSNRLDARRQLISTVDRFQKGTEVAANSTAKSLATFQKKAFDLITSPATKLAFDISSEGDASPV